MSKAGGKQCLQLRPAVKLVVPVRPTSATYATLVSSALQLAPRPNQLSSATECCHQLAGCTASRASPGTAKPLTQRSRTVDGAVQPLGHGQLLEQARAAPDLQRHALRVCARLADEPLAACSTHS